MKPSVCSFLVLAPALLCAQSFEVASVKPAVPVVGIAGFVPRIKGGPGSNDPGQISYTNISMQHLLMTAYGLSQPFRLSGPAWMPNEKYDIVAKVPEGATKDDLKMMLQHLLADRFQLAAHREMRDLPNYEMVVAKGGVKMKESVEDPSAEPPPPPPIAAPGASPTPIHTQSGARTSSAVATSWSSAAGR